MPRGQKSPTRSGHLYPDNQPGQSQEASPHEVQTQGTEMTDDNPPRGDLPPGRIRDQSAVEPAENPGEKGSEATQ